jgi:hypothetical protein
VELFRAVWSANDRRRFSYLDRPPRLPRGSGRPGLARDTPLSDCRISVVNRLDADRLLGLLSRSSAAAAVPKRAAWARHFVSGAHGLRAPDCYFRLCVYRQRPEFDIPLYQCLVLLLGLFALFCYVRELERLVGFSPAEKRGPSRSTGRRSLPATRTVRRMTVICAQRATGIDGLCSLTRPPNFGSDSPRSLAGPPSASRGRALIATSYARA